MKPKSKQHVNKNPPIDDHIRSMAKDPTIMVDGIVSLLKRFKTDYYKLKKARSLFLDSVPKKHRDDVKSQIRRYKVGTRMLMTMRRSAKKYPKLYRKLMLHNLPVREVGAVYEISFQRLAVFRQHARDYSAAVGIDLPALVKLLESKSFSAPKFVLT
jgi:hypothetical protein